MLNFIFLHLNTIVIAIWMVVYCAIVLRYLKPTVLHNFSYWWLVGVTILLHLSYGALVTWGQYHVWSTSSDITRFLLSAPLPPDAPLPYLLAWSRTYLEQHSGYFMYYIFGRVWLNIIILFVISGSLYVVLKLWSHFRGGFLPQGAEIILALLLVVSYPAVILLVPVGFAIATVGAVVSYFRNSTQDLRPVYIEPVFMIAVPLTFMLAKML